MKHSYNQKTRKYYSCKIRNVNIYLDKNQEKVWNEFNDFTYLQRIEHLINFYITHKKAIKNVNNYILCYRSEKGNRPCKNPLGEYITGIDKEDVDIKSTEYWEYYKSTYGENNLIILKRNKK